VPNPARADLPGRPPPPRMMHRDRSKEAATTYPTRTRHTEPARPPRHQMVSQRLTRLEDGRSLAVLCRLALAVLLTGGLTVVLASPAFAASGAPTLDGVISSLTNWIVGILAGVATLFLTIGGLRYLTAGGDPGQVERAKTALKSAAIGYALAILAPLIVSILASVIGGS
jgi:hypothetical protein